MKRPFLFKYARPPGSAPARITKESINVMQGVKVRSEDKGGERNGWTRGKGHADQQGQEKSFEKLINKLKNSIIIKTKYINYHILSQFFNFLSTIKQ